MQHFFPNTSHFYNLVCFHIFHTLSFLPCFVFFFSCLQGSARCCVFCGFLILYTMVFLANENVSANVVIFCNLMRGNLFFFPLYLSPHWKCDSQFWFLSDCKLIKNERFQKASKFACLGKTILAVRLATLKLYN